jgi:hypothetical protein
VLLDAELAKLYGVEVRSLNQAVKRNLPRFPSDFMFQLTQVEYDGLRSQFVTLDKESGRGRYRKFLPYAFTEQGVAMLSSVLRSKRAIAVNVQIMRAFVKLREMMGTHKHLARKLRELENKYDEQFAVVFDAIHKMMAPPSVGKRRRIGFIVEDCTKAD